MLTLDQAAQIASMTLQVGKQRQYAPLCVAVMDPGTHLLALLRDENAAVGRPQIAMSKAAGCLAMGFGGRELARRAQQVPHFYQAMASILPLGLIAVPGSVIIRNTAGRLLGAVGVSGDTSENDEVCAVAGISGVAYCSNSQLHSRSRPLVEVQQSPKSRPTDDLGGR